MFDILGLVSLLRASSRRLNSPGLTVIGGLLCIPYLIDSGP